MNYIITCCLLFVSGILFADAPGNKPRTDYKVKITGLQQYQEYTFYYQGYDSAVVLSDSSNVEIKGGFGAPVCVNVWAMRQKTLKHTDTLFFCSGDSETDMGISLSIENNHLSFIADSTFVIKEEKSIISYNNLKGAKVDSFKKNKNIMFLISGLSFLILIIMIFFVWNKNRKA